MRGVKLLLLALWLAALTACSQAPQPAATTAATNAVTASGRIAYLGQDGNVHTVAPSGEDRRAVTNDADPTGSSGAVVRYEAPTWAPASGRLAFVRIQQTQQGGGSVRLQIADPGGRVQEVDSGAADPFYLYWGPEGEVLSFLASSASAPSLSLWLAEPGRQVSQRDQGQPYYWDWTPDRSHLIAHVGGSSAANPDGARISVLRAEGLGRRDLGIEPRVFQAPAVSPDGERVLVAGDREDSSGLLVVDLEGRVTNEIVPTLGATAFDWSPAGDQVAYVVQNPGDPLGFGELGFFGLDEERARATGLSPVAGFFWSPRADQLAAFVPEIVSEGEEQQISRQPQAESLLLHLYLVEAESGQQHRLASFRPTEAFLNVLPFYDQYQRSATIWSPDGRSLVYSAVEAGGGSEILRLDAKPGATAVPIGQGTLAFWSFD